jgi:hypothetical protein
MLSANPVCKKYAGFTSITTASVVLETLFDLLQEDNTVAIIRKERIVCFLILLFISIVGFVLLDA